MVFNAGSAARQRGKVYKKLLFTERGNTQKLYKKSGSAARQWGKVYKKLLFTERGNTQKLYKIQIFCESDKSPSNWYQQVHVAC